MKMTTRGYIALILGGDLLILLGGLGKQEALMVAGILVVNSVLFMWIRSLELEIKTQTRSNNYGEGYSHD